VHRKDQKKYDDWKEPNISRASAFVTKFHKGERGGTLKKEIVLNPNDNMACPGDD